MQVEVAVLCSFFHVEWMHVDARTIHVHGVHEWIATLVLENGSSIEEN